MDLRERVIQDAEAGLSTKELTARYHVSRAWVDALKQRQRETGSIEPLTQTKFRGRVLDGQDDRLTAAITVQPDCDATGAPRGTPDVRGLNHRLARSQSVGPHDQKQPFTPTNNDGLTSPRSAGGGMPRSRAGVVPIGLVGGLPDAPAVQGAANMDQATAAALVALALLVGFVGAGVFRMKRVGFAFETVPAGTG